MFDFSVAYADTTGRVGPITAAALQANIDAAFRYLGRYFTGTGKLDISATVTAEGTTSFIADATADTGIFVSRAPDGGNLVVLNTVYELTGGGDANGTDADARIRINVDRLANVWLDPTPDDLSDRPPAGMGDGITLFVHEIAHTLGFLGNRNVDGTYTDQDRTAYDLAMQFTANGVFYDSPAVRAANGGNPAEVDSTHGEGSRWYHLADPNDTMFWSLGQQRKLLGAVDIAILHDAGLVSATPGDGDDIWFGPNAADAIDGGRGNDQLYGMAGNDYLVGSYGNDRIDGGDGVDVAGYGSSRANFNFAVLDGGRLSVTDAVGVEGGDTLHDVEVLQFSDKTMFFLQGNDATVARLYAAAFARAPDVGGLTVQLNAERAGLSTLALANNFLGSAEFRQRYGSNQSNEQYVDALYQNVLSRAGDPDGRAVQLNALAHGLARDQLLLNFADSPENRTHVATDWLLG